MSQHIRILVFFSVLMFITLHTQDVMQHLFSCTKPHLMYLSSQNWLSITFRCDAFELPTCFRNYVSMSFTWIASEPLSFFSNHFHWCSSCTKNLLVSFLQLTFALFWEVWIHKHPYFFKVRNTSKTSVKKTQIRYVIFNILIMKLFDLFSFVRPSLDILHTNFVKVSTSLHIRAVFWTRKKYGMIL